MKKVKYFRPALPKIALKYDFVMSKLNKNLRRVTKKGMGVTVAI